MVGGYVTMDNNVSYEQAVKVLTNFYKEMQEFVKGKNMDGELVLEDFVDDFGEGKRIAQKTTKKTFLGLLTKVETEPLTEVLKPGQNWAGSNYTMISDPTCIAIRLTNILPGESQSTDQSEVHDWVNKTYYEPMLQKRSD